MTPSQILSANKVYSNRYGWKPIDFGDNHTEITQATLDAIEAWQKTNGLTADKIAGPTTTKKLFATQLAMMKQKRDENFASGQHAAALIYAGQIAVLRAKLTWMDNVIDLPSPGAANYEQCRQTIDELIRSPRGINWTWEKPYRKNSFKWCGTLPAEGWGEAGIPLATRHKFFSSTYRLARWAAYEPIDETLEGLNKEPKNIVGERRQIIDLDNFRGNLSGIAFEDGTKPRAGDIMLIGPQDEDDGVHITMLVEPIRDHSSNAQTIEGNGTGYFASGQRGHGCVRAERAVIQLEHYDAESWYFGRKLLRPGFHDLVVA